MTERPSPKNFRCPYCKATAGRPCRSASGAYPTYVHEAREWYADGWWNGWRIGVRDAQAAEVEPPHYGERKPRHLTQQTA